MFFLQKSSGPCLSLSSLRLNVTFCTRLVKTSPLNPAPPTLLLPQYSPSFLPFSDFFLFAHAYQPLTYYIIYLLLCSLCTDVLTNPPCPPPLHLPATSLQGRGYLSAVFIGCIPSAEVSAWYAMGPQYIAVD